MKEFTKFTKKEEKILKDKGFRIIQCIGSADKGKLTIRKEGKNDFWLGTECIGVDVDGDSGWARSWHPGLTFEKLLEELKN